VLDLIYHYIRALRSLIPTSSLIPTEICWIPVYVGMPGNKIADVEAKLVVENLGGADYCSAEI
jgi:hypothetical protein